MRGDGDQHGRLRAPASLAAREHADPPPGSQRAHFSDQWWRLEMPLFHGEDAYTWVDRVERFFEIRGVPEEEWVSVAMVAMEGKALTWFRWWEDTAPIQTWSGFKDAIIRHFQSELMQSPFEILLGVRQEGSVKEFQEVFEMYSRPLKITERR